MNVSSLILYSRSVLNNFNITVHQKVHTEYVSQKCSKFSHFADVSDLLNNNNISK